MVLFDAALRGTLIGLLALLAALLLRDRPRQQAAQIVFAFMLGLIVQVASSLPALEADLPRVWQSPLIAISVGNAVLFWIFVTALFDDEFSLRWWHVASWLAVVTVSGYNCLTGWDASTVTGRLAISAQRGAPLLFAVLATVAAVSTWRLDLVEKRRGLRLFIVVTGVVYTVVMLGARLASPGGRLATSVATLDVAALLVIVAGTAFVVLRMNVSELWPQARESAAVASPVSTEPVPIDATTLVATDDPDDQRLAEALHRAMQDEHAYRIEGLTVRGLADRLSVPEYRLRRVINRRLGHRNFNVFVNSFRLDEATAALSDPRRRSLPILTIALEAGFQSIGPFNRAFRESTGQTPSEFRRQKLADC